MFKIAFGALFGLLLFSTNVMATCSSYPYTLTNGTAADATQVMDNFNCAALTSGSTLNSITLTGNNSLPGSGIIASSGEVGFGTTTPNIDGSSSLHFTVMGSTTGAEMSVGSSVSDVSGGDNVGDIGFVNSLLTTTEKRISAITTATSGTTDSGLMQFYTANAGTLGQRAVITPSGNFGIGTSSPSYLLTVNGTAYASGAAGALSDIRHKKDVSPLPGGVLQNVMQLHPVNFRWKDPRDDGMKGIQTGFIAQDVEKIFPSVVLTQRNAEKTKGLKYSELTAILTKAVQEQQVEISMLKSADDNQAAEIGHLLTKVSQLERKVGIQTASK